MATAPPSGPGFSGALAPPLGTTDALTIHVADQTTTAMDVWDDTWDDQPAGSLFSIIPQDNGTLQLQGGAGGSTIRFLDSAAAVVFGLTLQPADAKLTANELSLWLDATPGATKLMVKAKDSGGTVRTAAIALA